MAAANNSTRTRWHEEAADGALSLLPKNKLPAGAADLKDTLKTALALTDRCCDRRQGRVSMPPQLLSLTHTHTQVYVMVSSGPARQIESIEKATALKRLPELFFVPEAWSETEAKDWQTKGWRYQRSRVCARNSWIQDWIVVLPLNVQMDSEKRVRPQIEALSIAPLVLYFAPLPYIVPIEEFEDMAVLARKKGQKAWVYDIRGSTPADSWQGMEAWRVGRSQDVITRLESYFWGREEGGHITVRYGSLRRRFQAIDLAASELTLYTNGQQRALLPTHEPAQVEVGAEEDDRSSDDRRSDDGEMKDVQELE